MEIVNAKTAGPESQGMFIYRVTAVFLLTFGTLPVSINLIGTNCDLSGMYLLNAMGQMGLKFGSELMFTYGPLGFLYNTVNVDNNAKIALLFYGVLTVVEAWLLWCTFRRLKGKRGVLLIGFAVVSCLCGVFLWTKDYYICFLIFLAVSLAWEGPCPHRYMLFAAALTVIVSLIKFNTGLQCMITLFLFVAGKLLLEKRGGLQFLLYLPGIAVAYTIAFFFHNPSFRALGNYISTNLEISSGYSSAMSITPEPLHLLAAFLCGACFCIFLVLVFTADFSSGVYLFLFSGALFQCFKHGYVRADAHVYIFFMGFLMIITVMALFLDYDSLLPALQQVRFRTPCCVGLTATMLLVPLYALNPSMRNFVDIFPNKLHDLRYGISARLDTKIAASDEDILPDNMLEMIGQHTVAVLPWELSIGAYNDINMAVMPALQSMMAYTPSLDAENAIFFTGDSAPEYVVFAFYAIDGRVPLLETPATWQALYANYDAVLQEGVYLLLKKANTPAVTEFGDAIEQTLSSTTQVMLPDTETGAFVRLKTKLTLWGKLNKLFYQIPPVTITLTWSDGSQTVGRVLPEMLENGIVLDDLPDSLPSMGLTMNGLTDGKTITAFQFGGNGWKYYQDDMTVSFQEVFLQKEPYSYSPYEAIAVTAVKNPTTGLSEVTQPRTFWIDYINSVSPQAQTATNIVFGLQISGWALDDVIQSAPQAVYLEFNGQFYQLHQTARTDVSQTYFGNTNSPMCGFEGWLSLDDCAPGNYPLSLVIVCEGGITYDTRVITTVGVS